MDKGKEGCPGPTRGFSSSIKYNNSLSFINQDKARNSTGVLVKWSRTRTEAGEEWNGKVLEGSELLGVSMAVSGDGTLTSCKHTHTILPYLVIYL